MFEKLINLNSLIVLAVTSIVLVSQDIELTKLAITGLIGFLSRDVVEYVKSKS